MHARDLCSFVQFLSLLFVIGCTSTRRSCKLRFSLSRTKHLQLYTSRTCTMSIFSKKDKQPKLPSDNNNNNSLMVSSDSYSKDRDKDKEDGHAQSSNHPTIQKVCVVSLTHNAALLNTIDAHVLHALSCTCLCADTVLIVVCGLLGNGRQNTQQRRIHAVLRRCSKRKRVCSPFVAFCHCYCVVHTLLHTACHVRARARRTRACVKYPQIHHLRTTHGSAATTFTTRDTLTHSHTLKHSHTHTRTLSHSNSCRTYSEKLHIQLSKGTLEFPLCEVMDFDAEASRGWVQDTVSLTYTGKYNKVRGRACARVGWMTLQ